MCESELLKETLVLAAGRVERLLGLLQAHRVLWGTAWTALFGFILCTLRVALHSFKLLCGVGDGLMGRPRQLTISRSESVLVRDSCGRLRLLALIDDPRVIQRILTHLGLPTDVPNPRRPAIRRSSLSGPCRPRPTT